MTTDQQQRPATGPGTGAAATPEFGLKRPDQIKVAPPAGARVPPASLSPRLFRC